ncbi:MAG TPA: M1 family metallopeptidase [Flavisolibacter sp.]|nr:M1 family metallopeptidase [Flavisolibacter sp.]
MLKSLFSIAAFIFFISGYAQQIDVQHYKFQLELNDKSDIIKGEAEIQLLLLTTLKEFSLDLVQGKEKGMIVSNVKGENVSGFRQENNKLIIALKKFNVDQKQSIIINYSGVPSDGLIISKNKYGDRTFFSDNWPNRAHYWIPCNDVPNDKASFEFIIIAPDHYQVVSNGVKFKEEVLQPNKKLTHWKEDVPLSTKVMVIGAARFAVKDFSDSPHQVPVSAWVYPQDSIKGFYDYGVAPQIVDFFSNYIAPFPYNKLANVQSKTIFGGMENASAIFYAEESVTGNRKWEDVIAHEIAHQWFGDMASEKSFAHLWLSEGFATYLTDIYIKSKYGEDSLKRRLEKERRDIIEFTATNHHPVVDSTSNLMSLLNANSYQKGSWVLHMLHASFGNEVFQKIIQSYYEAYKGGNANTRDFEAVAEKVSGKDLKPFFDQWLYQPGIPLINVKWKYNVNTNELNIDFQQATDYVFKFPLEILFVYEDGTKEVKLFNIDRNKINTTIKNCKKPVQVIMDPDVNLLLSAKVAAL